MSKTKKLLIPISIITVLTILVGLFFHFELCPTYWKYSDLIIRDMCRDQIERRYGEYDFESYECAGYYIYTDNSGARHYYFMYFEDCSGEPRIIVDDTVAVSNESLYYHGGEEPEYIGLQEQLSHYKYEVVLGGAI